MESNDDDNFTCCNSACDSDNDSEKQCCGSGCNNCILDEPSSSHPSTHSDENSTKMNILSQNYTTFQIISILPCTKEVYRFTLRFCDTSSDQIDQSVYTLFIPSGHHVMIRAHCSTTTDRKYDLDTTESYVSRYYTPITVNSALFQFDVLVKFQPGGAMSALWQTFVVGDICEVKGTYGTFKYTPNTFKRLVCICQGVAVAPMYRIAAAILDDEDDETLITLLCCFRSIDDLLMRDEIQACRRFWNFQSSVFLSQNECECGQGEICECLRGRLRYGETINPFRLGLKDLSKLYGKQEDNSLKQSIYTLICGTDMFVNSMKTHLLYGLNINEDKIFVFQ